MALEAAFRGLTIRFQQVEEDLHALRLMLGDKPVKSEAALVDQLDNAVLDIAGLLEEAIRSAGEAQKAVGHPMDLERGRRALGACQNLFHRIGREFSVDLASYEKLRDLEMLGSQRGGEWFSWANGMKDGIRRCRAGLEELSEALVGCWQELAERLGSTSVSVHATNIGQQIAAPEVMSMRAVREEVP